MVRDIEKIHQGSGQAYGSSRVYRILKAMGYRVGKRTVERIIREYGLKARKRRKYRVTTDSNHSQTISPNIVDRKFDHGFKNSVWLSGITYLATETGWAYLATVMDAHTCNVLKKNDFGCLA